jgi:hypothetical protein
MSLVTTWALYNFLISCNWGKKDIRQKEKKSCHIILRYLGNLKTMIFRDRE